MILTEQFFREERITSLDRVVEPGGLPSKVLAEALQKEDDKRFDTSSTLDNDVNLGLGGDLDLRYRAGKHVDLQLKSGVAWIANNNFDGVATCCTSKYNWQANLSVGVVWKTVTTRRKRT